MVILKKTKRIFFIQHQNWSTDFYSERTIFKNFIILYTDPVFIRTKTQDKNFECKKLCVRLVPRDFRYLGGIRYDVFLKHVRTEIPLLRAEVFQRTVWYPCRMVSSSSLRWPSPLALTLLGKVLGLSPGARGVHF